MVGDNATFNITVVSDGKVNATGDIEIYFPSIERRETGKLINGTLLLNVTNLPARHYLPTMIYYGDDNYDRVDSSAAFDVIKYNPEINVTAESIMVGDEVLL